MQKRKKQKGIHKRQTKQNPKRQNKAQNKESAFHLKEDENEEKNEL